VLVERRFDERANNLLVFLNGVLNIHFAFLADVERLLRSNYYGQLMDEDVSSHGENSSPTSSDMSIEYCYGKVSVYQVTSHCTPCCTSQDQYETV
jgi:hypothetical protein